MPKANLEVLGNAPTIEPSPGRNRAVSESMFHTLSRNNKNPELDINDSNPASIVLYAAPSADRVPNLSPPPPEPDPFRANATTFYTPGPLLPPSPPTAIIGHARKSSKEDDIIWSLRTQLAIQQEMCSQYEVDLGARDVLVSVLNERVENAEKESEKRRGVVRGWKKKVQELERLCRNLEEEVDRSREESMERSVMDEASGEALRQLHGHIAGLEREKGELVRSSLILVDPSAKVKEMEVEVANLREELRQRDEIEQELQEDLRIAQEQIELLNTVGAIDDESRIVGITAASDEQERHRQAEGDWEKEREELRREAETATKALAKKNDELVVLREELEAQWKDTERTGVSMAQLKEERNVLQSEVVALEAKIESMELEWNDADNRRSESDNALHVVFAEREIIEQERAQVMSLWPPPFVRVY
jgi:DNA repair exonuclease SbcCD ATPase subunit